MEKLFKGTGWPWSVGHFINDKIECNCPWIFSPEIMGSVATINWSETELAKDGDNPLIEEAKYNAILIANAPMLLHLLNQSKEFVNEELKETIEKVIDISTNIESYNTKYKEVYGEFDY